MKAFRNDGWLYYDKVQAILPDAGSHAFSTLNSTQRPELDDGIEETGNGSGNVGSGGGGILNVDEATSVGSTAVLGNKRKFSALSTSDDVITARSNEIAYVSTPASARKRVSSELSASSSITSSAVSDLRRSELIALHGLQASINRFIDTVTEALKPENYDSSLIEKAEATWAINLLRQQEGGLSEEEMDTIVSLFSEKRSAVIAYLSLWDDGVRKAWVNMMLSKPSQ
jgi:hypothetical protein